ELRGVEAPEHVGHAEEDQRLAGEAHRQAELRHEIALRRGAEDRDRGGAGAGPHEEGRRRALEDERKRGADEAEQEKRAEPAREADPDGDEPGRGGLARLGHRSLDQRRLAQAVPDRRTRDRAHAASLFSSLMTLFSHQPPAAESPMMTRPMKRNPPASEWL